jgi:tetratricopeptide (TPR) repeat protein
MFDTFKKQVANGTEVRLFLTTGKEIIGIVSDISNSHIVIDSGKGKTTVFEKLIGGWEIAAPNGLPCEKSNNVPDIVSRDSVASVCDGSYDQIAENNLKPRSINNISEASNNEVPDSISLDVIAAMLSDFKRDLKIAQLNLKPPVFSFPLISEQIHKRRNVKKEWDRINSQFQYYKKIKNLSNILHLTNQLKNLGEPYPKTGAFNYNAGCFVSALGEHSEAARYFEKAYANEKLSAYIYNLAYSALMIKNYKKAHMALALYFYELIPTSDKDAWHVLCNLTEFLQAYSIMKKIIDNLFIKIEKEDTKTEGCIDCINLLCKSALYFLSENKKFIEAGSIMSFLEHREVNVSKAQSLINSSFEILPQVSYAKYNDAIRLFTSEVKNDIMPVPLTNYNKKNVAVQSRFEGYITMYKRDGNFGFLEDSLGIKYFFHRSEIIDDDLHERLYDSLIDRIPVTFETAQGQKGPVAIQISLHRSIDDMFKLAISLADNGEYPKAIAQIKRVLAANQNYPSAIKLYDEWREYAQISSVPQGLNPYARALRAQLIEKDLDKAEQLFRKAIILNDNAESAMKNLASLLVKQGHHVEAIDVLEKNRKTVKDLNSLDNHLINIYQKSKQYDKAIELLNRRLENTVRRENKIPILLGIAYSYLKKENYIKSQHISEEILKLQPDNITARRNIALCLSKQKSYTEAERILNQILDTSPDVKAANLLEAIIHAKKTGMSDNFDAIIIETSLSEFSSELSGFAQFFLDRCNFLGVTPIRIKDRNHNQKIYDGSEKDAKYDIAKLEEVAKKLGTKRPRERSSYYLSAARISQEVNDDSNQFYRYLCRSFASRGDAAVAENKHLDTAKEWYCEALMVYDGVRNAIVGDGIHEEQDAVNALIRLLFSTLGLAQIPITPKIPSVGEALEEIFSKHPHRGKVFDTITYLVLHSRYAANRILNTLYSKSTLQALALEYLANKGISIPNSIIQLDDFMLLWNKLRRKTFYDIRAISSDLKFLTEVTLTTASLENAIEQVKNFEDKLFFDLDRQRATHLQKILENALTLCKQITFEEQERLSIQIDNNCRDLIKDIVENPTKLSIEEINPVVWSVQEKVRISLEKLYATSMPQISLRLPLESYIPDNNQVIAIQIVVENKIGSSPVESLELIIDEDNELYCVCKPNIILYESLRGGDREILEIPLQVSSRAIESQTFSLPVYAQYHSRTEAIMKTPIQIFSIRLYTENEFEDIENPYAQYAEGGIVGEPKMFFGREELIQNIIDSIQKSFAQSKCIVVFGQKRSGKSSILHHLKSKLEKQKNFLILDLGAISGVFDDHSTTPLLYHILWNILKRLDDAIRDRVDRCGFMQLGLSIPGYKEFYSHPSPLVFFKDILDNYKRLAGRSENWSEVRLIVQIDEFSDLYKQIILGKLPDTFMKNWKAILQENYFNAILAGQDVMYKFKQQFPNEFGTTQDERVSYLKREDAIKLIDEPIRIGEFPGKSRYRESAIDRIIDLTAGSPFYIQILCNRLVEYMNLKRAKLVTQADVEHVKNELIKGVNALSLDKFDNLINSGDVSKDAISDEDIFNVLKSIALNSRTGPCNRGSINCTTKLSIDIILDDLVKRNVIEREREQYYQIRVGLFKEWLVVNQ